MKKNDLIHKPLRMACQIVSRSHLSVLQQRILLLLIPFQPFLMSTEFEFFNLMTDTDPNRSYLHLGWPVSV
jgi:hypothetical protein